jgi:hypothetical protein
MPDNAVLHICHCSVARCATGRSCSNLRERLDPVRTVPEAVLEPPTPNAAACGIRCLLRYAGKRERMRQTGYDFVRGHVLLTRQLRAYLTTMLCLDQPETSLFVGS